MNITSNTRIQIKKSQSSSVLGTETIVLNYELGNYYELNEMGSFIWSLLQANPVLSVMKLKERMLVEFDVEESVCQEELMSFLENLIHEKLIETIA
ncbi:PqqD family peptide modification chaperone [Spirosoma spitsbergense]|uniref:PqqD family peptide modification chaperone n=1 Tax=Spirosoma spitsbergense TaxID=431554 RepID=UPI00036121D9|nr:PqqD family peptide modification chaperone [Spirosoma spitsbergense]